MKTVFEKFRKLSQFNQYLILSIIICLVLIMTQIFSPIINAQTDAQTDYYWLINKNASIQTESIKIIDGENLSRTIDYQTGSVIYTLTSKSAPHCAMSVIKLEHRNSQ